MERIIDITLALSELLYVEMPYYYDNAIFEEDNFQRGREIHSAILFYTNALWDAIDDFWIAYQPILAERQGDELASLAEHDLMIRYYMLRLMHIGFDLSRNEDTPVSELAPQIEQFRDNLAALSEIYEDENRREQENFDVFTWRYLNVFVESVKQLEDILTEALASGQPLAATMFNYRLDTLVTTYNRAVMGVMR